MFGPPEEKAWVTRNGATQAQTTVSGRPHQYPIRCFFMPFHARSKQDHDHNGNLAHDVPPAPETQMDTPPALGAGDGRRARPLSKTQSTHILHPRSRTSKWSEIMQGCFKKPQPSHRGLRFRAVPVPVPDARCRHGLTDETCLDSGRKLLQTHRLNAHSIQLIGPDGTLLGNRHGNGRVGTNSNMPYTLHRG